MFNTVCANIYYFRNILDRSLLTCTCIKLVIETLLLKSFEIYCLCAHMHLFVQVSILALSMLVMSIIIICTVVVLCKWVKNGCIIHFIKYWESQFMYMKLKMCLCNFDLADFFFFVNSFGLKICVEIQMYECFSLCSI